jgi:putative SOS response-associated peptidase YedK
MPVSVYRAAGSGPHTGGKSPASRPARVKSRETRTVRWRKADSNCWSHFRCLVPVDNFYEWKKTATGKQPYAIALADRDLMALAGL